ncbi:RNA-binding protein 12B-like [Salarias fasciatus]|uniref:RNA-binding protein 12B-like n=1 Tax=Salarias fasciatus TaxID=181472 RepID=UPI001176D2F8|nr:RNA-binding protein 12B-like [Salarias fasciatus]
MFQLVLLFLALSGLEAAPVVAPKGLRGSSRRLPDGSAAGAFVPDGFRQGTEPSRRLIVDLNTGLVREHLSEMDRRAVPADVPVKRIGGGWLRVEERSVYGLPEGFRQGTERSPQIPEGFRQGTERSPQIPEGFRQGTERSPQIPEGFRQGTERSPQIPEGFRQGTERSPQIPEGFRQGTERSPQIPEGFRQGTERSPQIPEGFRQGTERSPQIPEGFRQGTERSPQIPEGFRQGTERSPQIPEGFRQGTERSPQIPEGFRQGTERSPQIPEGFRQGTERSPQIPEGFRQGTERSPQIPEGFRQGTERSPQIPEGFRQGTERSPQIPEGFRQGTEHIRSIPDGFRQGTEPRMPPSGVRRLMAGPFRSLREGFRQGTEPSSIKTAGCMGEIISGKCYEFQPTPLTFRDAQARCRASAPNAELASVSSGDLHARLVSLVTRGGQNHPVLTWLGAAVQRQRASWADGSAWRYSDWMPGHPNIHTDKPVCVEMFRTDESWWTAADCDLKRASICAYPLPA